MILPEDDYSSVYSTVDDAVDDCLAALICPLGRFYPNKSFGNCVIGVNDRDALLAGARQAVSGIDGVYINKAEIIDGEVEFSVTVNDEQRSVRLSLEKNV